jgi:hypothetical protein
MNEYFNLIIVFTILFIVFTLITKTQKQKKRQKIATLYYEREKEATKARELKAKEMLVIKKAEEEEREKEYKAGKEKRAKAANAEQEKREKAQKAKFAKEEAKKRIEYAKIVKRNEFIEIYNESKLLLQKNKILPLGIPIDKTGDIKRYENFKKECSSNKLTSVYLYLVRIKSNIDDKKLIKIGLTSNKNIEKRFNEDDVIDLIEVIRFVKLETKLAMAIEYSLIQKHRPKDYLAEKEFDVFSRFGGYTEIIPMRHTKDVAKDIDSITKDSENISSAINVLSLAKKELDSKIFLWLHSFPDMKKQRKRNMSNQEILDERFLRQNGYKR